MKTWGIVLIVVFGSLSLLSLLVAVIGAAGSDGEFLLLAMGGCLIFYASFIVLGAYMIHRAKQKEEEKKHHDNWSNE